MEVVVITDRTRSFSKTLLPTFRLGFVVTPPTLTRGVQAAKYVADWHSPIPLQATLARFIDEGLFARHLRKMSAVYRERHTLMGGPGSGLRRAT